MTPTASVDAQLTQWVTEWAYATDRTLIHTSGFAVEFDDTLERQDAIGDIVPGTAAGYSALLEQRVREADKAGLARSSLLAHTAQR